MVEMCQRWCARWARRKGELAGVRGAGWALAEAAPRKAGIRQSTVAEASTNKRARFMPPPRVNARLETTLRRVAACAPPLPESRRGAPHQRRLDRNPSRGPGRDS